MNIEGVVLKNIPIDNESKQVSPKHGTSQMNEELNSSNQHSSQSLPGFVQTTKTSQIHKTKPAIPLKPVL